MATRENAEAAKAAVLVAHPDARKRFNRSADRFEVCSRKVVIGHGFTSWGAWEHAARRLAGEP